MFKRSILATSLMALALSAAPALSKDLNKIGISLGTMGNPFFVALAKGAEAEAKKVDGKTFVIIRQAGESGQLYGSVSPRDIADAASAATGVAVHRNNVELLSPIKAIGIHTVAVALHPEVSVNVQVNVARSEDEAERQARGENVSVVKTEGVELETFSADEMFEDGAAEIPGTGEQPR